MAKKAIPVDLFNPGQVFACLGLMEAADILLGEAEGGFDWGDAGDATFTLSAAGGADPVGIALDFLRDAKVHSIAPAGSELSTRKWDVQTEAGTDDVFPYPEPSSPATLPAVLVAGGKSLVIDHWGDASERDNVKFWAGSGGYPGAGLLRDALDLVRERLGDVANDPFSVSALQSSSFRFDWRRDYIPLDAGFSPNEHGDIWMVGFPLVEVLAAIGVTHARPARQDKLTYRYAVARADARHLPLAMHRAALGCADLPFDMRRFEMRLGWPGQENQARCIIDVVEENL